MEPEQKEHLVGLFGFNWDDPLWYVGYENTIGQGISDLLNNLNKRGYILFGDLQIIDYLEYDQINYFIIYKALPTLEYLESLVDKNLK